MIKILVMDLYFTKILVVGSFVMTKILVIYEKIGRWFIF